MSDDFRGAEVGVLYGSTSGWTKSKRRPHVILENFRKIGLSLEYVIWSVIMRAALQECGRE